MTEQAGTLTRAELAEAIGSKTGFSHAESLRLIDRVLSLMSEALRRGENVKLSGFGTFVLRDKAERMGRNPKTGREVPITSRRVLTFRASLRLRDRIAQV